MKWLLPPETVRRFTPHQIIQHAAAVVAWVALTLTAIPSCFGVTWATRAHLFAGPLSVALLLYHLVCLIGIGIRHDMPAEKIAFLPWGREWAVFRGGDATGTEAGKYTPAEKADYLGILAWSTAAAVTGLALRWPSALGIPSLDAFGWLKAAHAGSGAALAIHLLTLHVTDRWIDAPPEFRTAILTGMVPLRQVEGRTGWVRDLVGAGVLVPAPVDAVPEEQKESQSVRDLLETGNRRAREGDYEGACEAFRESLRLLPGYSQARFNLAVALFRKGDIQAGREQLEVFIEMDPFNPMAGKAREMLIRGGPPAGGEP